MLLPGITQVSKEIMAAMPSKVRKNAGFSPRGD